jgi:dethiobiotin synthetase
MSPAGIFVTGTDTGVGKTLVACALLEMLNADGISTGAFKPVAAGARQTPEGWRNEDAELLMARSSVSLDYAQVNPVTLPQPVAPHIAAARVGVELEIPALVGAFDALARRARFVVSEGAGGWLVPLGRGESMADLAAALGCPVMLVVGMRLGCLNHALLTVRDIRRRGLALAGWIGNCMDPAMPELDANVATLDERIDAPRLGLVPWIPAIDHGQRIARAVAALDADRIRDSIAKSMK